MAWKVEGTYFETCSCEVVCPCTASLALGADYDRCRVTLVFNIQDGEVDGTDVSGLKVAAIGDAPKVMTDGNWRLGMVIDANASDEQAEKLGAVFSGQLGGPMEALGPLIGEQLGVERVPMNFSSENGHHKLTVGDMGQIEVDDVVPFGSESGEAAKLTGVFHPASSTLTISKATEASGLTAFGLDAQNA